MYQEMRNLSPIIALPSFSFSLFFSCYSQKEEESLEYAHCSTTEFYILNPRIKIEILICCPYSFPIEAVGRSWQNIKQIHLVWLCPYFSWPLCFTKHWYYMEKIWCWSLLGLKGLTHILWRVPQMKIQGKSNQTFS